jgi:hypothetical protein
LPCKPLLSQTFWFHSGPLLYTIHVNTDGDPTSQLLQNCAGGPDKFSDPSKFYTVTSANGLGAVFTAIRTNLTKLRVANSAVRGAGRGKPASRPVLQPSINDVA